MKLTAPQKKISDSKARFRVVSAGRRFGKTWLSINELAKFARFPNQRVAYMAPTYKQAKQVVFQELPKTSTGKIQKFELRKLAKDL